MTPAQKLITGLTAFLLLSPSLDAQTALGEWRTHLPYHQCTKVVKTSSKVYCSALGGMFYYDLEDNSLQTISKIDGLSDNGLSAMRYYPDRDLLVLAYENANIDLISEDGIVNIPDIMKKQIPGDKSVYDINFVDNLAYLSCGFGIVVINLDRLEIKDSYYIGDEGSSLKVNQTVADDTYIYAATNEGIRRARLDDPFLLDYTSWELINDIPDYDGPFSHIAFFNDRLFATYSDPAGIQDKVYLSSETGWSEYTGFTGEHCNELKVKGDHLIMIEDTVSKLIAENLLVVKTFESKQPLSADLDDDLKFWIADYGMGLIHEENGEAKTYYPNGPYYSNAFKMTSMDGDVYVVGGGITASWSGLFRMAQMYTYAENRWKSTFASAYQDLVDIVADPDETKHVYAASFGYGLLEFRDYQLVEVYNESNSSLQSIIPGEPYIRLGGITSDEEGNIWMTNCAVAEPLSVLKTDGTWKSFEAEKLISDYVALGDIIVTQYGHIWAIIPKGHGLFVMNDNGTIDNTEDDEYVVLDVVDKNGKVITNQVYSIAEDLNGTIWIGTDQGVLVFYSPYRLFTEGELIAQEIIVPRNDGTIYGDPLLYTEKVTSIEVDGANRKWCGTEGGGVFLVSADGQEEIFNFNTTNSPLISDIITDICVNDQTGEVFFGTDKGIVSFMGEATGGSDSYSNIKVYPNPVRESYTGDIAISGLLENSKVKITDISGNLVYETTSLGGQAIWDGNNFFGERVASGVYLIFLSSKDGLNAAVAKILFIH